MRSLAFILFVANLLAFSWLQGWLDRWIPSGREPLRVAQQVAPSSVQPMLAAQLDALQAQIAARCLQYALLDEPMQARLLAWASSTQGVRAETTPGRLRLRLPLELTDDELAARRDELTILAGRTADRCTP